MAAKEKDGIDAFLFGENMELVDFKCFRGDRPNVSEDDIKKEIHSAFVQRKMKRAVVSEAAPKPRIVAAQKVHDFVKELAKSC